MSLYPLNELKRRLDDDGISLPKRLRLAKNVVNSHHFATAPKGRIVADWLESLMNKNKLTNKDVKEVLAWVNNADDLTSELKTGLIKVVSQYLHSNPLQKEDVQHIVAFLENDKVSTQLSSHIDEYLFITTTLLQHLKDDDSRNLSERIFNNVVKYYKESKRKLEFIIKLLDGENLETIFSYLDTECRSTVINLCQNILFPITKKSFYASFLNNLIRKDNIDELIAEKGDNIQSVIKIMSAFFTFPKGRTGKDQQFLFDFINLFVSCYRAESQLIFAFYIMVASALNMTQSYMNPAMKMPPMIFDENDEKIKRCMFLNMLNVLHQNEVDVSVKLTDTLGEKIAKVEIKKNFTSFLQAVMIGQLKLEGKPDKTSLQIIKTALKLDPSLIEQKINQILPQLMTVKKSSSVLPSYIEMINCLLEVLFKLSRGIDFVSQLLPHLKLCLEGSNVEQFELKQNLVECLKNGEDCEKIKNKILTGEDIFPKECVEMYGRLTSELMFRQNKDLLLSLQKDLEENCLMMLEEGFVSPSIITLAEVLSDILCNFLRHSKMADHTIPLLIIEDFWTTYQSFENVCLKKFGECILKLSHNPPLVLSFLKLCLSVAQLKLLNIKYSNKKLPVPHVDQTEVFDLSLLLPCLDGAQWMSVASKLEDDEAVLTMENLLLAKTMALELLATTNFDDNNLSITTTKSHLIKEICSKPEVITDNDYYSKVLFTNLDKAQCKQLAKTFVKSYLNNSEEDILKQQGISNNKPLLQALVLETVRTITKCFENANALSKGLNKIDFDMPSFVKDVNVNEYLKNMTINIETQEETINNCLGILKYLQIYYLEENYQLTAIFVLLALKRCCQSKKMRRSVDYTLQSIYELSARYPDIYKIFPVNFIFSFEDESLIDLLTLTIKTSNNLFIVKSILESAVKKVKTDSEIVKSIVEILVSKHKKKSSNISSIEYFSDPVFQIICIVLPLIAKEKKAITTSAFRSILASLQEKLNQAMLDSFKNIDFANNKSLCADADNLDDSMAISSNTLAILNAMGAYTLTLLKCCETTDAGEIKNLDCLWSGLEFFVQNAIQATQNTESKSQHIESSVQLLNVTLRYIKKLETHDIFQKKDEILLQIWHSVKARLLIAFNGKKRRLSNNCLEDVGVTLKFLAELSSVECFATFMGDLILLSLLKKPSIILKNEKITNSQVTAHKVSKYLWVNCLKANIVGPKCVAMSKIMYKNCKNIKMWIQQHYDDVQNEGESKIVPMSVGNEDDIRVVVIKLDDSICDLLRIDLDTLSEVILAAKKIPLDYKFLDAIFELQHLVHYILGRNSVDTKCEISWQAFFALYEGCYGVLNSLLLSREELLEDRWPCYMQCFKPLVQCLCERATSQVQLDKFVEEKLAETAHSIEKLTQSICKRKAHVSRISAYAVADFCSWLERTAPPKMVRQHLENSIALLIQASDSTYAMAFLKRALAGAAGQMTMSNMYTVYKRYHKYVGNA